MAYIKKVLIPTNLFIINNSFNLIHKQLERNDTLNSIKNKIKIRESVLLNKNIKFIMFLKSKI